MNNPSRRCYGIVTEFNKSRGWGTIQTETGENAFVRYSAIIGEGVRSLQKGDRVVFNVEQSARGLTAVRVTRQ